VRVCVLTCVYKFCVLALVLLFRVSSILPFVVGHTYADGIFGWLQCALVSALGLFWPVRVFFCSACEPLLFWFGILPS
jgi:hypothetical protein